MKLDVREFVRLLLLKEKMTQKELAELLCEKTGARYTQDGLSHKLNRGSMSFNETVMIAEILGYELDFKKIN